MRAFLSLARLDESQRVSRFIDHLVGAQVGIQQEDQHTLAGNPWINGHARGGGQLGAASHRRINLVATEENVIFGLRIVPGVGGAASPRGEAHPDIECLSTGHFRPAAHCDLFRRERVGLKLNPALFFGLQVGQEESCALVVGRENALIQPGEDFRAEVFAFLLTFRVGLVCARSLRRPLHLGRDLIERAV